MPNPFLPLNDYVPDGEPHVFGNRVYLYGSHDAENGDRFCMNDYTVYSAPIDDLDNWSCHGVSYKKDQDPKSSEGKLVDYYAPDCVQGNDGRYYLYYVAMGPNVMNFGPMSVAVSDKPEGPFEYYGDIRYPDGTPVQKYLTNDPAVLNDNGRIWLYYGWGIGRDFRNKWMKPLYDQVLRKIGNRSIYEVKNTVPSILSCAVVELENDMLTVKREPQAVLDSKTTADKKSDLYNHAFYEAPSIRRFGELYYLVYSSGENHELAYAISNYPDHGFEYRGVIISNTDQGYQGNTKAKANGGTIHGGIELINGQYYIFYHRCTNNTDFSRQACAEPIEILPDGTIEQVEITTQGMSKKPMIARGIWKSVLACNLYHSNTNGVKGNGHNTEEPTIVCKEQERYITAIDHGTIIGYKYLHFNDAKEMTITTRGGAGKIIIYTNLSERSVGEIVLSASTQWSTYKGILEIENGIYGLYFVYEGNEKIDFLQFEIK